MRHRHRRHSLRSHAIGANWCLHRHELAWVRHAVLSRWRHKTLRHHVARKLRSRVPRIKLLLRWNRHLSLGLAVVNGRQLRLYLLKTQHLLLFVRSLLWLLLWRIDAPQVLHEFIVVSSCTSIRNLRPDFSLRLRASRVESARKIEIFADSAHTKSLVVQSVIFFEFAQALIGVLKIIRFPVGFRALELGPRGIKSKKRHFVFNLFDGDVVVVVREIRFYFASTFFRVMHDLVCTSKLQYSYRTSGGKRFQIAQIYIGALSCMSVQLPLMFVVDFYQSILCSLIE